MRIRSTKPEFYRSRTVASVDWDARFVLKALESYVDDNGVGKDDLELIASDTFPRDLAREGSRILARLSEAIGSLHQAGLVWRYEIDGQALLYISSWESIQRIDKAQAGRFPRPDGTFNYRDSVISESVATPREPSRTLAPGTGEQGNRGTGEQTSRPAEPDTFDAWWSSWPRKEARAKAQAAYAKALKTIKADELERLTTAWFAARPDLEPRFIPLAASWLNARRWEDEPPTNGRATTTAPTPRYKTTDEIRREREEGLA